MEFEIKKSPYADANKDNFSKSELDIAYEFAKHMKKELGDFIKSIVLFGSTSKNTAESKSDVDILVIIDDLSLVMSAELVESYRIVTEKVIGDVSTRLHVTSLRFTTFWDYVKDSNPIAVNILRDGFPLIDVGFIGPLQHLLRQGKIMPSVESIWHFFSRCSNSLVSAKGHLMQATVDLYWSVIDAAQSVLMRYNIVPPSPEHVPDLMMRELVPRKIVTKKHTETVREFFNLSKLIMHHQIKEISGVDFDDYYKRAYHFVADMKKELEKVQD